jgi:anti-anti-sigma factor
MSDPLLIDVEHSDGVCILHCKGRFVPGPGIACLRARTDDVERLERPKVLADFEHVTSIGSVGLSFLVDIYASVMRKMGGRFVLAGVAPLVRHVLDLTRLSAAIPLAPDVASGLAVLRAEAPMDPIARSSRALPGWKSVGRGSSTC